MTIEYFDGSQSNVGTFQACFANVSVLDAGVEARPARGRNFRARHDGISGQS